MLVPVLIASLILAAVFLIALRSAYDVRVMRDTLTSPLVPPAFDGTRIVFVADVHAGRFLGSSRVSSLVELVQSEGPSLIILGGDYVGGRTNGARHFYPEVSRLDAPLGVVAVLGNHDSWEGDHDERHELAAAGITVLENEAMRIASGDAGSPALVVAGLADEWTGTPDVDAVKDSVGTKDYGILVAHNPDSLGPALHDDSLWSLALAGHTHGGQFRGIYELLPHKPMNADSRYLSGWTHEAGTEVLVSNGVGVVTLPLRMFAPAQIHVITLRHDPAGEVASGSGYPSVLAVR